MQSPVTAPSGTPRAGEGDERAVMQQYWEEHSAGASIESMMLDSDAKIIDATERPEVRADLPSIAPGPFRGPVPPSPAFPPSRLSPVHCF